VVIGLDVWQAHFKDFPDRYVLVGGVACDLLMDEAGLTFRATKDLDVVLLVEVLDAAFGQAFWRFVEAGGYERTEKADGGKLYRFAKPATAGYPFMIELFSRAPEGLRPRRGQPAHAASDRRNGCEPLRDPPRRSLLRSVEGQPP
jgi:glutathionyl-hydroquinone reductase